MQQQHLAALFWTKIPLGLRRKALFYAEILSGVFIQ